MSMPSRRLAGLLFSLAVVASGLPPADSRRRALAATANGHAASGLAAVTGEHYEGGHWLGSFAAYLLTSRGR